MHTIGFVTWNNCARVFREAFSLLQKGYRVKLFTQWVFGYEYAIYGEGDICSYYGDEELAALVREHTEIDIWHVHTEPTWMVSVTADNTDKPVVFDAHDLWVCRDDEWRHFEQDAFDKCAAVVHVGERYGQYANDRYGYNGPSIVLKSQIPVEWYVKPREGEGLVYEGGATTPRQCKDIKLPYRDFTDIFRHFIKNGMPVDLYMPNNAEAGEYYRQLGCEYKGQLFFWALLTKLAGYEWGLAVFDDSSRQIQNAMPNKLFDYLAAGIPVIATRNTTFGDFVEAEGIGITVDPNNLPVSLPDSAPYRRRVIEVREKHAINISPLEELYAEIA